MLTTLWAAFIFGGLLAISYYLCNRFLPTGKNELYGCCPNGALACQLQELIDADLQKK